MIRACLLFLGASLRGVDDFNPTCASNMYIIVFCYDGNIHSIQRNSPLNVYYIFILCASR
jgi:hypothetical protein